MSEVVIRLDVHGRWGRGLMAGALALFSVSELASENFTLTTYYPAPSGVYTQLIVTGDAYLARDSGKVGIRTMNPAALLDVNGSMRSQAFAMPTGASSGYLLTSDAVGNATWQAPPSPPSGAVIFFALPACPAGWTPYAKAQGRYVVGLQPGSPNLEGTPVGTTPLSDLENRATGRHIHGGFGANLGNPVTGSYNTIVPWGNRGASFSPAPAALVGQITDDGLGFVPGTNAPYVQLLACRKL